MFHVDPASLAPAPASAGTDGACASPARALIERRIAALSRLADMGMEIAEAATRAATTAPDPDAPSDHGFTGDPVLAYTRAARAVRQSFALQSRLLDELAALDKAEAKETRERKSKRRQGLQRLVEEALDAERPEAAAREFRKLSDFTFERLRDADEEADLLGRPFAEAVARICADLGLSAEWTAQVVGLAEGAPAPFPDPPPSGLSRGPVRPAHDPEAPCSGTLDARARPEDDGEASDEEWDTFLEWPPPPPA